MKKSDLKTGMRVRTRNGIILLVIKDVDSCDYGHQDVAFVCEGGFECGSNYRDDLTVKNNKTNYDIMEVYQMTGEKDNILNYSFLNMSIKYSIWKRQEYSDEQKEVFKALKMLGFNWIARDDNDEIYTYELKPLRGNCYWSDEGYANIELCTNKLKESFNFIKWEDKEPFEIPTL